MSMETVPSFLFFACAAAFFGLGFILSAVIESSISVDNNVGNTSLKIGTVSLIVSAFLLVGYFV